MSTGMICQRQKFFSTIMSDRFVGQICRRQINRYEQRGHAASDVVGVRVECCVVFFTNRRKGRNILLSEPFFIFLIN